MPRFDLLAQPGWRTIFNESDQHDRPPHAGPGQTLVARGPWTIDKNHEDTSLLVGPHVLYVNGWYGSRDLRAAGLRMRGATLELRVSVSDDVREWASAAHDPGLGGGIELWWQGGLGTEAYPRPHTYNFVWHEPIPANERVSFRFPSDLRGWRSLGSGPGDRARAGGPCYAPALDGTHPPTPDIHDEILDLGILLRLPNVPGGRAWQSKWVAAHDGPDNVRVLAFDAETTLTIECFVLESP